MAKNKALNVAIVGGGPGCKAIMDMIFAKKLSQLRMKLIGVADIHQEAVGCRFAREKGIFTTEDYRDLYELEDLNMIIELTGSQEVANDISRTKPDHVRLMDHVAARLFWDVFQIEEQRIHECNLAEKQLRESEERYRTVLQEIPDPVIVYDMEGRGTYINPAFTRVFGWAPEEILARKPDYVPQENWPETQQMIDKVLAGESFFGVESRRYTKEGKILDVRISASVHLNPEGVPVGSVHILRDITERKLVREALKKAHDDLERRVKERTAKLASTSERLMTELMERRRAEERVKETMAELERSNAELQRFAYIASHDLQEPLRKIQAFGDRLKGKYADALDERGRDYLSRMENAAARMQALINDLLTLSRVTTQAQPFVSVDLAKVVQDVLSDLELHIEKTQGSVEVGDMPTIDADPTQMRQLFQNLIDNGLKFHQPDEKPVVKIHAKRLNGACQIVVKDNGIGFDEKYLERIFTIFQRLHGRGKYDGTGVGLAICRKIVERHGGSITAQSIPNQGATFTVTLPIRRPPREEVQND
jgi:PAS domain S-box-containing protein